MPADEKNTRDNENTPCIKHKQLKLWCYLVSLMALLLTTLPAHICRMGLCILLFFAPLAAAQWLRTDGVRSAGRHLLWLLLALGWAVGLLTSRGGLVCASYFCLSLLCWSVYLCYSVYAQANRKLREIFLLAFAVGFYDPVGFFTSAATTACERKKRNAEWTYILYILGTVLVLVLLLLVQADSRIDAILRIAAGYALEKAPLVISCLLLALFPAAILYSFLSNLKDVAALNLEMPPAARAIGPIPLAPQLWPKLCILLTAANWFFLLVEIYYDTIQRAPQPLVEGDLYDVLAVVLLIFIGLAAICCRIGSPEKKDMVRRIVLGASIAGLIIAAGHRLFAHTMSFGFWNGQTILSVVLLAFVLLMCCMLLFSNQGLNTFFRKTGIAAAAFLMILNIIPSGVALTEINASIFLYKYHMSQLDGQRGMGEEPVELTSYDLRLDLMESYGLNGIPALTRLVEIEDVTVAEGRTLGLHVQDAILNCLCDDLGLTRTGDNQNDLKAVFEASDNIPRYRLPTSYSWTLSRLNDVKNTF